MATKKRSLGKTDTQEVKRKKRTSTKAEKVVSWVKAQDTMKTAGLVVIGMIAGKQAAIYLKKGTEKVSGMMGIDLKNPSLIADAGVAVGGLLLSQLIKNKDVKLIGVGITAAGAINVVKDITGRDFLAGLGDTASLGNASDPIAAIGESEITKLLDQELAKDTMSGANFDIDEELNQEESIKGNNEIVDVKINDIAAGVGATEDYADAEFVSGLDGDDFSEPEFVS